MPRLSGPETLRRMRDISPELRTVVMSGFDEEESLRHFEGLETDHFIHKPFQVEQLQDLLSRTLPQGGGEG
jgi:YesN/AraC family two-component response regulator